ncbi:MAG: multicopper oxidase family protein [Actinobacteria bacterium]|nr:multicopper oxidase family protein [Actinomycetota bacterium]
MGAAAGLTACSSGSTPGATGTTAVPRSLESAVRAAEAGRTTTGKVRSLSLVAKPVQIDLGGRTVSTWAYGDTLPGAALRATAGDRVKIAFSNELPEATSVHWHGLAIRNDMDGVPGVTTPEVAAGGSFAYDFVVPDPGTHWFHPHTGLQLDRGLYAPFIVDDPAEPGDYDTEWVVVLDDWTDGVGKTPDQIYADLTSGATGGADSGGMGGMSGMGSGSNGGDMSGMGMSGMGMSEGDVAYPFYLVNGRVPDDPDVLTAKPGQRVRLRIINAASDTIFTVALGGHDLVVTHTDGYPVKPTRAASLRIGMGERYDAVVTLADGVFPLVASPSGKEGLARALVRSGSGQPPAVSARPGELDSVPLTADMLTVATGAALAKRSPDTSQDLVLAGTMSPYAWTVNGAVYEDSEPLKIRQGQAGRLRIRNRSMMPHPMHVHGHTFQLGTAGGTGPRKDTVLVPAMGGIDVDLIADNPGRWMVHCHNTYHAVAGMMTRLDYTT